MSSQGTRKSKQEELERPLCAGPTRQVNAEELLAELKRLLSLRGIRPSLRRRLRRPCSRLLLLLRSLGNRRRSKRHVTALTT